MSSVSQYWPRRSAGLPPGQRLLDTMPRFSVLPHRPPPAMSAELRLAILDEGKAVAVVTAADLPTALVAERSLRRAP